MTSRERWRRGAGEASSFPDEAYVEARLGTVIVIAWVLTTLLLIVGLGFFFRETRLAGRGPR